MGCQCFQIDGPFIEEDPSCAVHGVNGTASELEALSSRLDQALQEIAALKVRVGKLEEHDGRT